MMKFSHRALTLLAGIAVAGFTLASCDDDDKTVTPSNTTELTATINSAQQVPGNAATGTGTFSGTLNRDTKVLTYTVTHAGLTGPVAAAHIHFGKPGRASGVMVGFIGALTSPFSGTVTIPNQAAVDSLLNNKAYVNLHTAAFTGGEIRGNVTKK